MNSQIVTAKKKLAIAKNKFAKTVASVQKKCKHTHLAEAPYENTGWSTYSPLRICLDCGMTEDGWGCGYIVLKGDEKNIGRINRNEIYRLREGLIVNDDAKGPILRREKTVAGLITEACKDCDE